MRFGSSCCRATVRPPRLTVPPRGSMQTRGPPSPPASRDTSLPARLEIARSAAGTDRTPIDDLIWAPVDRVPVPARPGARQRPPTGARAHFRKGSRLTLEDLAGELNDN